MKITTAKEFMQVIAKHYEKCRAIYWNTMHGIPFELFDGIPFELFDGSTIPLKGLPEDPEKRQRVAIMLAILAAPVFESGEAELEVNIDALLEVREQFAFLMTIEKFIARGYMEWDKDKKDEDGFPLINVIVPPDEWDMNEEA